MKNKLYLHQIRDLEHFAKTLKELGASKLTVKNYVSDVRAFLKWRANENHLVSDKQIINLYIDEMTEVFSKASLKRKRSAIKKYLAFASRSNLGRYDTNNYLAIYSPILLIGLFIVASAFVLYNNRNSSKIDSAMNDTPISISKIHTIDVSKGNLAKASNTYYFEDSQGVKIFLSEESPKAVYESDVAIENEINTQSDIKRLETIANEDFSGHSTSAISIGERKVVITSELVNKDSFIQITPTSKTNQVLYIESQGDGYMVVAVSENTQEEVHFQWKADNTEVYHSIL